MNPSGILTTFQNPISSLTFISSATNSGSGTALSVTIPTTAQHGDLAIIFAVLDNSTWTATYPTGWAAIGTTFSSGGACSGRPAGKIITNDEINTSISISSSVNANWRVGVMIFRPVGRIYSWGANAYLSVGSTGAIGTQTLTSSSASAAKFPVLTLASATGRPTTQSPVLTTTSNDGVIQPGGATNQTIGYKIFAKGATTTDVTASCTDAGQQYLDMFYITF